MDYIDMQIIPFREKQYRCKHPSWRCSCCKLFKDNIMDKQQKEIEELKAKNERLIKLFNEEIHSNQGVIRELSRLAFTPR